jgi:hypothetical protein
MALYARWRAEQIEATAGWRKLSSRSEAAAEWRAQIVDCLVDLDVAIPTMSRENLITDALDRANERSGRTMTADADPHLIFAPRTRADHRRGASATPSTSDRSYCTSIPVASGDGT